MLDARNIWRGNGQAADEKDKEKMNNRKKG